MVDVDRKVDVNIKNKKINDVLDVLFKDTNVDYIIVDRQIVLSTDNFGKAGTVSQQSKITGKITDSDDLPLPGVTVIVKGTTNGTVSDVDGNYTLSLPAGATTLVYSFIGMRSEEIEIAGQTEINVKMLQDFIGIEEVVAIGYGTSKKEDLVSSVSQVKAEVIANQPTIRVDQALQGRASGVEII